MNENTITIVAILISVLVVFVVYKHIELTVHIRDIVNVTLKANRNNNEEEPNTRSDSSSPKS